MDDVHEIEEAARRAKKPEKISDITPERLLLRKKEETGGCVETGGDIDRRGQ